MVCLFVNASVGADFDPFALEFSAPPPPPVATPVAQAQPQSQASAAPHTVVPGDLGAAAAATHTPDDWGDFESTDDFLNSGA